MDHSDQSISWGVLLKIVRPGFASQFGPGRLELLLIPKTDETLEVDTV